MAEERLFDAEAMNRLRGIGVTALPNNPTGAGYSALQIKNYFSAGLFYLFQLCALHEKNAPIHWTGKDPASMTQEELSDYEGQLLFYTDADGITTTYLISGKVAIKQGMTEKESEELSKTLALLMSYFLNGKAKFSIADEDGFIFKDAYANYMGISSSDGLTTLTLYSKSGTELSSVDFQISIAEDQINQALANVKADFEALVEEERNRAIAVETSLNTGLSAETSSRISEITRVEGLVSTEKSARETAITSLGTRISEEATARSAKDVELQEAIDAINSQQNFSATYADKASLPSSPDLLANDCVLVLKDETKEDQAYVYKWTGSAWAEVGPLGDYYTKAQVDAIVASLSSSIGGTQEGLAEKSTVIANGGLATLGDNANLRAVTIDGTNYDISGVFEKDVRATKAIGIHDLGSGGYVDLSLKGKTLTEAFEYLYCKEESPSVTNPSVSISCTSGSYEAGTAISPTYRVNFSSGQYEYGPATGITATYEISDTEGNTATSSSGTLPAYTVKDGETYSVSVTATYTAGATPYSNLGNELPDLAISAGSVSAKSASISSYRAVFVGYFTEATALSDITAISSSEIRALGVRQSLPSSISVSGMKQIVVAFPTGRYSSVGLKNAVNGAPLTTSKLEGVMVYGANGYTAVSYDVWYSDNAVAESSSNEYLIELS